jgi:hypothetical protein
MMRSTPRASRLFLPRAGLLFTLVMAPLLALPACSDDDPAPAAPGGGAGDGGAAGSGGDAGSAGSAGDAGSAGSGGVPLDDVGTQFVSAICATVTGCQGEALQVFGAFDCEKVFSAQFNESSLPLIKDAVAKGTTTYDGTKVEACVAYIKTLGCAIQTTRTADAEECKGVFIGKSDAGKECTTDIECAPGLFCKVGSACPGVCAARQAEGQPCGKDDHCQTGFSCENAEGGRKCGKPLPAGAACGATTASCASSTLCIGEDANAGTPGACKTSTEVFSGADGGPCDLTKSQFCKVGLSCVAEGSKSVCRTKVASGAACKLAIPDACPSGEFCEGLDLAKQPPQLEGTCKALPGDGLACVVTITGATCAPGLVCTKDSKCKTPAKNGATCAEPIECLSGHCTDGACSPENICKTP